MMRRRCVKVSYECMHGTCQVTVHLCLLLQDDGTGVSEDHSMATSSSATAAVNQRDDTAVSSISIWVRVMLTLCSSLPSIISVHSVVGYY